MLLIINLVILSFGAGRILIYGSMRFDSFTHDISSKVVNLNDNSKSISTGKAILLTSLILCSGFLTLSSSSFTSTHYVGLLISITLAVAVVADLILLPVLLRKIYKK